MAYTVTQRKQYLPKWVIRPWHEGTHPSIREQHERADIVLNKCHNVMKHERHIIRQNERVFQISRNYRLLSGAKIRTRDRTVEV